MKDFGFLIGFFVILIVLAISTAGGNGIFSGVGTTTRTTEEVDNTEDTTIQSGDGFVSSQPITEESFVPPQPKLSPAEIERKVADIYRELDRLSEALRVAKLNEPASPYKNLVTLRTGNVYDTDPEREYLMLYANSSNELPINISDWYIESYVTEERVAIPQGDRILNRWRYPNKGNIILEAGETAYLITGESPINTSFHENICTGYLADEKDFYPSLVRNCPAPRDEMKRFATIALDNDSCYDFVERISYCTVPDEDTFRGYNLTNSCKKFLESTLNHDDCVLRHRYDPYFDDVGYWHIYLERDSKLWRSKREIIRLMDEHDRVIDVIEY